MAAAAVKKKKKDCGNQNNPIMKVAAGAQLFSFQICISANVCVIDYSAVLTPGIRFHETAVVTCACCDELDSDHLL